jgi:2-phospho-L-lactate/phosphoenolpyruvate guanylyltransferase
VGGHAWALVIPVKPLGAAKTRLRGAVPSVPHGRLVLALALDTVAAARDCAEVYVVSDDPAVGRQARALGARVLPDEPRAGLNAAVAFGASYAYRGDRGRHRVAALAADLPALRSADLAAALAAAAARPGRSYVPDASGDGTTLLAAASGQELDPRFGPGSAAAHTASGARPLRGDWPSLRRDVDTPADLAAAARLGLGPHTRALLPAAGGRVADVQGTVATYDEGTRTGTLLLDDGSRLAFPASAFDASGLRTLRLGQRLRIEYDESGEVARVTIPTLS